MLTVIVVIGKNIKFGGWVLNYHYKYKNYSRLVDLNMAVQYSIIGMNDPVGMQAQT